MLKFCYTLDYPSLPLPIYHVRVFACAEKYFILGLAKFAADRFTSTAASQVSLDLITDAIAEVHDATYDPGNLLRSTITDLVLSKANEMLSGKCAPFDALMDSHPSLAADVARAMAKFWIPRPKKSTKTYKCPDHCQRLFTAAIDYHAKYEHRCVWTLEDHVKTGAEWARWAEETAE